PCALSTGKASYTPQRWTLQLQDLLTQCPGTRTVQSGTPLHPCLLPKASRRSRKVGRPIRARHPAQAALLLQLSIPKAEQGPGASPPRSKTPYPAPQPLEYASESQFERQPRSP